MSLLDSVVLKDGKLASLRDVASSQVGDKQPLKPASSNDIFSARLKENPL